MAACLFVLASCTPAPAPAPEPPSPEAELAAITDRCGLRPGTLQLVAANTLHIRPHPTERYEAVDCALQALRKSERLKSFDMGFVGNEALSGNGHVPED